MKYKLYFSGFSLILLLIIIWFTVGIYLPKDFPQKEILFSVEKGESLNEISSALEKKEIIRSKTLFSFLALLQGKQRNILAADYRFVSRMSIIDILREMTEENGSREKTIIIEGWNLRDIAFYFENKGMFQAEELFEITGFPVIDQREVDIVLEEFPFDFLKEKPEHVSLEGYLFPDSYEFDKDAGLREIVEKMLGNFETKTKDLDIDFTTIIMASLLEKEVQTLEDKMIVAGILWKRLRNGWPLQVDATLTYLTGKSSSGITIKDKEIDSLYNTYKYRGLPLGPICNPGLESIKATLAYEESDYWFYLTDKQGNTIFSKTLEEHNENKYNYLR